MTELKFKAGDKVLVAGIINSDVRNEGIHVLHGGVDSFYPLDMVVKQDEYAKLSLPIIPRFVADWIEENKQIYNIYGLFIQAPDKVKAWFGGSGERSRNFALACLFGYEVEKEKKYIVRIPNTKNKHHRRQRLCYDPINKNYFFCGEWDCFKTEFTKQELEDAGFGWVFEQGFAEEVEE